MCGTSAKPNALNEHAAHDGIAASQAARRTYSVEDFLQKLIMSKRNVTAIRDEAFPEGLDGVLVVAR